MDAPRFDALARALAAALPRRRLVQALAALGLGGTLTRVAADRAIARRLICPSDCCNYCDCKLCPSQGGVAGMGLVQTAEGTAQLRLLATQHWSAATQGQVVVGFVSWIHPGRDGILIESVRLETYGPIPGVEGGREVRGWAWGGAAGAEDPFVLRVVAHPGGDRAELWAGEAARLEWRTPVAGASDYAYHAGGDLVAGELQLLSFEAPPLPPLARGTPVIDTPTR